MVTCRHSIVISNHKQINWTTVDGFRLGLISRQKQLAKPSESGELQWLKVPEKTQAAEVTQSGMLYRSWREYTNILVMIIG